MNDPATRRLFLPLGFWLLLLLLALTLLELYSRPRRWSTSQLSGITFSLRGYTATFLVDHKYGHKAFCVHDARSRELFEVNTYGTLLIGKKTHGLW